MQVRNSTRPHNLHRQIGSLFLITMLLAVMVLTQALNAPRVEYIPASLASGALVSLTNSDRVGAHEKPLQENQLLKKAAQMKADDMAARGYFSHVSPDGVTPWKWIQKTGYNYTYAGENLAVDFSDTGDIDRAWMASTAHRANMLNRNFTEIGIGIATGTYDGQPSVYVVQMFGTPVKTIARN